MAEWSEGLGVPGPETIGLGEFIGEEFDMLIRDKTGGSLLQAELEPSLGGNSPPILMADNGRKSFEIDAKSASQYYRLISATKAEVEQLKKAGYRMDVAEDFEAR
jgi:hypothetical protein